MTNLKCPYCGSTDTIVRKAGELNKQLNTLTTLPNIRPE